MRVSDDEFDEYVREAVESIEPQFRRHLEEVPVIVEDEPDRAVQRKISTNSPDGVLGIFSGVPLNRRSSLGSDGPNRIVLYRRNILAHCSTPAQLAEQIRKTLVHELGHYLGFSENQLRRHRY